MGKPRGQRAYELYEQLPDGARKHTDKAIRIVAKATRKLRDRETIEKRGKAWVKNLGKAARRSVGR